MAYQTRRKYPTKNVSKVSRSWTLVFAILAVTILIFFGYGLMHHFSWATYYFWRDESLLGSNNQTTEASPTQSSLPASLATVPSNKWNEQIEEIAERLTLDEITKLTFAVPGITNPGLPKVGIKPFTWNLECYHGNQFSDQFPASLALAATFSSELIHEVAATIGSKARFHWESKFGKTSQSPFGFACFAPNVNLMRDPRWSGNVETLGEDPLVISTLVSSYLSGLHGNNLNKPRIMSGCRYMSAFSGPEDTADPLNFDARILKADLYMTYLKPFQACVVGGSLAIMCSNHKINGVPSCAEANQLSVELRHNWHYKGMVVSDVDAVRDMMTSQGYRVTSQDTASSCIAAGCNFELTSKLPAVYESQTISVANRTLDDTTVRDNIKPILHTAMLLDSYDKRTTLPAAEEEKELQIKSLVKSFVLLKNDGLLPLRRKYKHLVLVGRAAGPLLSSNGLALHGLQDLAEKWTFVQGCSNIPCTQYNFKPLDRAAADADLMIFTLSNNMNYATKTDYSEEGPHRVAHLMQKFLKKDKHDFKIMLLLFMASPIDISWALENPKISAILECFRPVEETGVAIYRTLMNLEGHYSPGGRLPFTWPKSLEEIPKADDYNLSNRTYRYSTGQPLLPFGFGLSYSSFKYSDLQVPKQILSFSPLKVIFSLTNTGPYKSDEVVQAYVKWHHARIRHVPRIQLIYFKRVSVKSGEIQRFTWSIPWENFAVWTGHKQGYTTLPVPISLFIGGQQPNQNVVASSNVLTKTLQVVMTQNQQNGMF